MSDVDGEDVKYEEGEYAGWLLKKRKKRMQGWAKRWFEIREGFISYGVKPEGESRGTVRIATSAISTVPKQRLIHIDSGSETFHVRAVNDEDYLAWFNAIQFHKEATQVLRKPSLLKMMNASRLFDGSHSAASLAATEPADPWSRLAETNKKIEEELDFAATLVERLRVSHSDPNGNSHAGSTKSSISVRNPSRERLSILKLRIPKTPDPESLGSTPPSTTPDATADQLLDSLDRIRKYQDWAFQVVRKQYELEQRRTRARTLSASSQHGQHGAGAPAALQGSQRTALVRKGSIADSLYSNEIFFDALDDILVSETPKQGDTGSEQDFAEADEFEYTNQTVFVDAADDQSEYHTDHLSSPNSLSSSRVDQASSKTLSPSRDVQRRKALPAPASGEPDNLLTILRKNIGKDLSRVAMPISMNEPLNMLQNLCEELEYCELLTHANKLDDSLDRMMYVAAFAVSPLSSRVTRVARKPFNPLHGETYECIREDKGFRFVAEKVSHHPLVMACHADSRDFTFWQDFCPRSKFWGKSMEFNISGLVHVELPGHGDHFTYNKPTSWVRNILGGTRYLEYSGDIQIMNHTTQETCKLSFKEGGYFTASTNEITGHVYVNGRAVRTLTGRWTESLCHQVSRDHLEVLWRASPPHPLRDEMYGFTPFAMELNELTPDLEGCLPVTDTRLRPDQQLFEHGRVEEAEKIKVALEEKQRKTRHKMAQENRPWVPQWFERVEDPLAEDGEGWVFTGEYWQARQSGRFPITLDLFSLPQQLN